MQQGKRAFLFPGTGSQRPGMIREYYQNSELFKKYIRLAEDIFQVHIEKLYIEANVKKQGFERICNVHAALAGVSLAVINLLNEKIAEKGKGLYFDYACGRSLGFYLATCFATSMDPERLLLLLKRRVQSVQKQCESLRQQRGGGGLISAFIGKTGRAKV